MLNKTLGFALAAGLTCAGSAFAADLPVREPAPAYAPPVFTWTGFYAGLNAGGASTSAKLGWTCLPTCLDAPAAIVERQNLSNRTLRPTGFVGGGQVGYNWQTGSFVFGIEADADFLTGRRGSTLPLSAAFPGNSITQSVRADFFGTVRGRLGFAVDRLLVYATGGLAVGHFNFADSSLYPGSAQAVSASKTKTGWTVGGGVEYAVWQNWSVKAEYLYSDFGTFTNSSSLPAPAIITYIHRHKLTENVLRLGINYRF